MQIIDYVCGVKIAVGEPSKNHVQFWVDGEENIKIELGYSQWLEFKAKIDKMFEVAKGF